MMQVIKSINSIRKVLNVVRKNGKSIGFIPTMGALHDGHLGLIRQARKENDMVVVSIFVNPIQFGPKEDLRKYPRNLKKDAWLCQKAGVDYIFCPSVKEMYNNNYSTNVVVEGISDLLCGKFRPGHFRGVTTVVTKLFNLIQPDIAYFGQKDAQQAIIIKKMVMDLNIPVKIKVMPTAREKNGLAISSRNIYLSSDQRKKAVVLYQALKLAKQLVQQGRINAQDVISKMKSLITAKGGRVEYISIVDLQGLRPLKKISKDALIALAVYMGKTRLIDNIVLKER